MFILWGKIMKVKKEFYLPNKGVLSLYNISYLESDFNLVIKNITDSLKCEGSIELYNSISSKLTTIKENDIIGNILPIVFSNLQTRSEKALYMFKDIILEDKFIEYLMPINYNQSWLQLFISNYINSITYQESIYGLSFPTNIISFEKIASFLNNDNMNKYQKYLREYLQVFNFEYKEIYSKEDIIKDELNRIIKSDLSNLFNNKYFLLRQIEEDFQRKMQMATANAKVLKLGNRKV